MPLNDLIAALVAEMEEDEIANPLGQEFPLALIWHDLARLAGEELPAAARFFVGDVLDEQIAPVEIRGCIETI